MRMIINENMVIKRIADILKGNPVKMEQFARLISICIAYTSDTGVQIEVEMYPENIVRYIINGTRCNWVCTYNTQKNVVIRKPRNIKPWYSFRINNAYAIDIENMALQ